MDIYLLICTPDHNMPNYTVHRVVKCIATTLDAVSGQFEAYMRDYYTRHMQPINIYPLIISRPPDISTLGQLGGRENG